MAQGKSSGWDEGISDLVVFGPRQVVHGPCTCTRTLYSVSTAARGTLAQRHKPVVHSFPYDVLPSFIRRSVKVTRTAEMASGRQTAYLVKWRDGRVVGALHDPPTLLQSLLWAAVCVWINQRVRTSFAFVALSKLGVRSAVTQCQFTFHLSWKKFNLFATSGINQKLMVILSFDEEI